MDTEFAAETRSGSSSGTASLAIPINLLIAASIEARCSPPRVLKELRAHLGDPQVSRGTVQQPNPELAFEFSNPTTDRRDGHLQEAGRR